MKKLIFLFVALNWVQWSYSGSLPRYYYHPIELNLQAKNWKEVNRQLDSIEKVFPDSVMVPLTAIRVGEVLEENGASLQLKEHAYRMLQLYSHRADYRIPPIEDPLWRTHVQDQVYALKRFASAYLSDVFYAEKQYDSCLQYIDDSEITWVYNARSHDKSNMALHLHRIYRKSVCLEKLGNSEMARKVLLPYLFLDDVEADPGRFKHTDVVEYYFTLKNQRELSDQEKDAILTSMKNLEFVSEDSLLLPAGWKEFYTFKNVYAVKVEEVYIPVVFSYLYWIDHPKPASEQIEVENPVLRQLNPEVPEALPKENPEELLYMKAYLKETLLFRK